MRNIRIRRLKLVLSNMQYDDMHNKLSLALESGKGAPDVVDIELGKFPSFTNGKIGLMDLTDAIAPYKDNVVESRLDIYGKRWKNITDSQHTLVQQLHSTMMIC